MKKIGGRVNQLLKTKGITAYELSVLTGISQATISRIINKDTKPNIENSKILSKYFNVSKEWLLTGTGEIEILNSIPDLEENIHEKEKPPVKGGSFENVIIAYEKLVGRLESEINRLALENERLKNTKE